MYRTEDYRRHQSEKRKRRVLQYYGGYMKRLDPEQRDRHVGIHAKSSPTCSCPWCGHRRLLEGPTAQEKRQEAWYEEVGGHGHGRRGNRTG